MLPCKSWIFSSSAWHCSQHNSLLLLLTHHYRYLIRQLVKSPGLHRYLNTLTLLPNLDSQPVVTVPPNSVPVVGFRGSYDIFEPDVWFSGLNSGLSSFCVSRESQILKDFSATNTILTTVTFVNTFPVFLVSTTDEIDSAL